MSTIPKQRATITDVAKLAGVSIATVSRVINSTATVTSTTAERVQRAIDALNFQPHPVARSLAGGKTHTIGMLVPDLTNPFFSLLMRGVEESVRNYDYDLLVHLTSSARLQNGRRVHALGEHNTDGLLIFTDNIEETEIDRLHSQEFPLVLLFRTAPQQANIPTITIDNATGTCEAIEHLIRVCGRRRIAFMQGLVDNEDSLAREQYYRKTLAANNIPFDPQLIARGDFNNEGCAPVINFWLQQGIVFDAIFADSDMLAVDIITVLREAGIRVPEQVAVIGFDNLPITEHIVPTLTTVYSPIVDAGRLGAERLIEVIQTGTAQSVILPTRLIIRQSTRL